MILSNLRTVFGDFVEFTDFFGGILLNIRTFLLILRTFLSTFVATDIYALPLKFTKILFWGDFVEFTDFLGGFC